MIIKIILAILVKLINLETNPITKMPKKAINKLRLLLKLIWKRVSFLTFTKIIKQYKSKVMKVAQSKDCKLMLGIKAKTTIKAMRAKLKITEMMNSCFDFPKA